MRPDVARYELVADWRSRPRKHGHERNGKRTRIRSIWVNMRTRCYNVNNVAYPLYGARGIRVCDRWRDFAVFVADMGEPPPGMSLERKDNDGDYSPANCRWATAVEQRRNQRKPVRTVIYKGRVLALSDALKEADVPYHTLQNRVHRRGLSVQAAFDLETGHVS